MNDQIFTANSVCAVSFNGCVNSCSLSVPIAVSVLVSLLIAALTFVAGLFSGMCVSKRRFKTAADTGQLPPSSAEEPENSSKTAAVYEEVDLHQVKPTDIQLTDNADFR